ncbi:MAG TPA: cob(I)yrinic acid a,c-diamide adenosyltransferase [Solimonas sp.]|nr:cob(I)yrinic acid a,c-diamide adenosyltransferase [Solimonas sp.]
MGHRLSKIVTRTGDTGTTGLATGGRIAKSHARIDAMGEVDELNCQLGLLLVQARLPPAMRKTLGRLQHELFNLGGELAMPGHALVVEANLAQLEADVVALNTKLPPLKEFVLPGGNAPAAQAHLARAVARRVERALWRLHEQEPHNAVTLRYANRLSDYLFCAARTLARRAGGKEVTWSH